MPDAEGNIKTDITGLDLFFGFIHSGLQRSDSPTDIFAWFHYPHESTIDISNPPHTVTSGGLRIKKIETFDRERKVGSIKSYDYGLGVLMDGPKYSTMFSRREFFSALRHLSLR